MKSLRNNLTITLISLLSLIIIGDIVSYKIVENKKSLALAQAQQYESYRLANQLYQSSTDLTRMVRTYSLTKDLRYKKYFQKILDIRNGIAPRPKNYSGIYWDFVSSSGVEPQIFDKPIALKKLMKKAQFTETEFDLLRQAQIRSDKLVQLEVKAMNAMVGLYQDSNGKYTIKRSPSPTFAQKILYGSEYHKSKSEIMKPIEQFFKTILGRTKQRTTMLQERGGRLDIILQVIFSLSIILIFLSTFLIIMKLSQKNKLFLKDQQSKNSDQSSTRDTASNNKSEGFGNKTEQDADFYYWHSAIASSVAIAVTIGFSWWFLKEIQSRIETDVRGNLESQLRIAQELTSSWIEDKKEKVSKIAVSLNLKESDINKGLHQKISKNLKFLTSEVGLDEYILVKPNGGILSSSNFKIIGKKFLLSNQANKEILQPPLYQAVQLPYTKQSKSIDSPTRIEKETKKYYENIIVAASIRSKNKKELARLYFLASPKHNFGNILQRFYTGSSQEIFMINSQAYMISQSRWENDLINKGFIKKSVDPSSVGFNFKANGYSHSPLSVRKILSTYNDGLSLKPYNNYLNKKVIGAWTWNKAYNYGLIIETKESDAFHLLYQYKGQALITASLSILLIFALTILSIWNKIKISKINKDLGKAFNEIKKYNEKIKEDLIMSQRIQMDMLPKPMSGDFFNLYALLQPAQEVSGDFYDFTSIHGNKLYFAVGDVSGKGVPAALFMAVTKVHLRRYINSCEDFSTKGIIKQVNDELSLNNQSCMFVTLVLGVLNLDTGEFTFTNAGHNPLYVKKKNGDLLYLENHIHGPPLGAFDNTKFEEHSLVLEKEDSLFFYTDGITEAMNSKKDFYGDDRLHEIVKISESDPQPMISSIMNNLNQFTEGAEQSDDITMLSIQYLK